MTKPERAEQIIDRTRLQKYALWYLQKQFPSKNWLRQKMQQFAERHRPSEQPLHDIIPLIDSVIAQLEQENIINDQRLAESLNQQWRTRGLARRKITSKLYQKGFARTLVEQISRANESAEENDETHGEEALARAFAIRRKLGPYRHRPTDNTDADTPDQENNNDADGDEQAEENRGRATMASKIMQKDLAKLARAGFAYDVAKKILKC